MCINNLIGFNYDYHYEQDVGQIVGSALTKPLVLACGREVTAYKLFNQHGFAENDKLHIIARIFLAVIALAILPLTLIGLLCTACSSSHSKTLSDYKKDSEPHNYGISPPLSPRNDDKKDIQNADNANVKTDPVAQTPVITKLESPAPWLDKVQKLSAYDIMMTMEGFKKKWFVNKTETRMKENEEKEFLDSMKKFNDEIFAFVKRTLEQGAKNSGEEINFETPRDFLSTRRFRVPISIGVNTKLEEGRYYDIESFASDAKAILELEPKKVHEVDAADYQKTHHAPMAVKYENGNMCLYMPLNVNPISLHVNGKSFPAARTEGTKRPFYPLIPGDVVGYGEQFLFKVGPGGFIQHSDGKRYSPEENELEKIVNEKGQAQAATFKSDANTHTEFKKTTYLTTRKETAVIDMYEPLHSGFKFYAKLKTDEDTYGLEDKEKEQIIFDPRKDPIFRKIVDYFKEEFQIMKYNSNETKMMRLAIFANAIADPNDNYANMNENYYLGDFINSGSWKREHNAFLIKALASELNIPCAFIDGSNSGYSCAWNVFPDGDHWILAPSDLMCFAVNQPPGTPHMAKNLEIIFGYKELAETRVKKEAEEPLFDDEFDAISVVVAPSSASAASAVDAANG